MADKKFIKVFIREKKFDDGGSLLNCAFDKEEFAKLEADDKGLVNIVISKIKEPKEGGTTHYAYEDEYRKRQV